MYCEKLLSYVLNKTSVLQPSRTDATVHSTLVGPTKFDAQHAEDDGRLHRRTAPLDQQHERSRYAAEKGSTDLRFPRAFSFVDRLRFSHRLGLDHLRRGQFCLAKVLYSKRFRLLQTDRIVLCLALSKFVGRLFSTFTFRLVHRRTLPCTYRFANRNLSISFLFIFSNMALPFPYVSRSFILLLYHLLSSSR